MILDIAPIINGYASDIGYSCIIGQDDVYDELIAGLEPVRDLLVERVRSGDTLKRIYQALDEFIADNGWANVHRCYPLSALGHLLMQIDPDPAGSAPIAGFVGLERRSRRRPSPRSRGVGGRAPHRQARHRRQIGGDAGRDAG